jgi:hypothetical protein
MIVCGLGGYTDSRNIVVRDGADAYSGDQVLDPAIHEPQQ